ncbi:MAG: response regulator [Desulfococcaceae bacterium]|jgi:CheY-like chemotaxis protein|nr:response regulator [Desulfococcaceae bacterium]
MNILIVDDDPIVVESCRRILEPEGISVRKAGNAVQAVEILEQESNFDLILTDVKMPGKDGFQLLSHIRKTFPMMPILMMTGYLTPETIEKGRSGGAEGFIAKPFTPEELIKAVEDILSENLMIAAGGG